MKDYPGSGGPRGPQEPVKLTGNPDTPNLPVTVRTDTDSAGPAPKGR